jgi:N-acetylmuramoyl-L-alanine amidase
VQNFDDGDVFLSLHMNSASAAASGSEVLFDDQKPQNAPLAGTIAKKYAAATGLKNRGAKLDTTSHEGNVFLLGRCPGKGFLIETGFITNPSDLAVVRAKAADAISEIVIDLFG